MKRAALYIRVSTEEQARHGFSLGEQRADLERYARSKGYIIYDVYADEGTTARKGLHKRKELQRLLDDVQAGNIDVVCFKCLDRWFRNIADYYKVQEILDKYGVLWECSQESYTTANSGGLLMLNVKLSVAQNESDQTSERVKYVNEGLLRRGLEITGKHPYGYKLVDKKLQIVEDERPIVEFAFEQILLGSSNHSIAGKIWEKFQVAFAAKRVWRMLRNPTYKGERHGISDFCPAIIAPEKYDAVQAILGRNKPPTRTGLVYLFTGKLICPSCGCILVANCCKSKTTGKYTRPVYVCGNKNTSGKPREAGGCQFGGGVSETVVERWLVAHLFPLLEDYQLTIAGRTGEMVNYGAKIKTVNTKLARLKELYLDALIDKNTYKADYERLQKELENLSLASKKQAVVSPAAKSVLACDDFERAYWDMSRPQQRELWQSLIDRITMPRRPEERGKTYKDFIVEFK